MTLNDLRAERKELENRILRCCDEFKKRTGLTVVALGAETSTTTTLDGNQETYLCRVRVGLEQI